MSAAQKPIRLPPLKTLRVRTPNGKPERACMAIMSSVLCKSYPIYYHQQALTIGHTEPLQYILRFVLSYRGLLTNLLLCIACWASAGYSTAGCAQVEQALRACMDGPRPAPPRKSEVNYHLARFKDKLTYPEKKKR
jgi:hypothetical protein